MAEIKDRYNKLAAHRERFERQARDNERFTLCVLSDHEGRTTAFERDDVFNDIGPIVVKGLASSMVSIMLPPQVPFLRLEAEEVEAGLRGSTRLDTAMRAEEKRAMTTADMLGVKSTLYDAFLHIAVGGSGAMHFKREDDRGPNRTRFFTLDQCAFERIDSFTRRLIVRQSMQPGPDDQDKQPKDLFTEVDFLDGTVRQEQDEAIDDVDDEADLWIPLFANRPASGQHYAEAYVTDHVRTLAQVNVLSKRFAMLVLKAATNVVGIRAGSGLNPEDVRRIVREGTAYIKIKTKDDIQSPMQAANMTGLQYVAIEIQRLEERLRTAFMVGILDSIRPKTAFEMAQIIEEINRTHGQFYHWHQNHTLLPLSRALLRFNRTTLSNGRTRIEPKIVTGLSAITRRAEINAMTAALQQLLGMMPQLAPKLNDLNIATRVLGGLQIDTGDLINDGADVMQLLQQLDQAINTDPRVLAVVYQYLQSKVAQQQEQIDANEPPQLRLAADANADAPQPSQDGTAAA